MNAKTVFALSAMFMVHAAFAALSEATTAVSSKSYSDASMWAEGDYPDGRGATLAIGGSHTLGWNDPTPAVDRNVTLGSIIRKADTVPAYTMFFIPGLHHGVNLSNAWDPMYGAEHQNGVTQNGLSDRSVMTNSITLWATGDAPAVIGSKTPRFDETGSDKTTVNAEAKKQVWMMIDMPLVLKSDLLLTHEGVVASQIGAMTYLTSGNRAQPYAAIELGGPISTPPGEFHDLIVSNPVYRGSALRGESAKYIHNAVLLQGENTFKGNVRVKEGVLRLSGESGIRGTIPQLGDKDNKVYVSAEGAVDLMGGKTPASHHLYLGGLSGSTTFGNLYSSDLDPLANAEWCGPVTLTGNAAIGGYPAFIGIAGKAFVMNSDGNLRVSGPIDGAGDLSVRGARQIEFSGDNSAFTGDMILDGTGARTRFLNAASLPATGKLVMNGGVVRVGAATDADISTLGSRLDTKTKSQSLRLDIAEGVTYNPAQGFVNQYNFSKTGKGTLVLDKNNAFSNYKFYLDEGETVFDFTKGATSLWGETTADGDSKGEFHLANKAHMIVKVPDVASYENHGFQSLRVLNGMFARFTLETEKRFQMQSFNVDANGFLMVDPLEGAGEVVIRTNPDGGPMDSGNVFYGETTYACRTISGGGTYGVLRGFPDDAYATTFDGLSTGASTSAASAVDVTASLVAGGPVSFTNRCLRFNTPVAAKEIVVDMTGFTNMVSGTILLTPNLGDTHVIFRGGALTAPADGAVRIVNLNTNAAAYVEIDCDIVSGGWALDTNKRAQPVAPRVNLVIAGKGRTVFKGNNKSNLNNYFIDCNIELPANQLLANHTVDDGDARDMCYVNGATFLATENVNLVGKGYMGSKKNADIRLEPTIGRLGMGIGAAAGKTLTISRGADFYFKEGGSLDVVGAGTLDILGNLFTYSSGFGGQTLGEATATFPTELVFRNKVSACTVKGTASAATQGSGITYLFGERPFRADVADGATFMGPSFMLPTSTADTSAPPAELGRRHAFVVPKGATVTFDRATGANMYFSLNWNGSGTPAMYAKTAGHFAGEGTIVMTDSIDTTKGICPMGAVEANFRGTVRAELPYLNNVGWTHSLGVQFPYATFEIPSGKTHAFAQLYKNYFACRFGALSGSGNYQATASADSRPGEWTFVGCDDATVSAEFTGDLEGGTAAQPLVKVGKSTQKFSGTGGNWRGSVMVRDGKLILGHQDAFRCYDNVTYGPFYWDYVLVGGDKVTAGMEPQFLVEGVETVKNPVRVLACADASVTPVVGVESGVTTISKLTVSNNVKVVANAAGSKVTIGAFASKGAYDVSVGGAGEVAFAGNVTLPAGFGATVGTTFTTDGTLTVGDNAPFSLTVPGTLDPSKRYTLISAAGGITGTFDFSGVSLPTGWRVLQKANAVVLSRACGMVIVFW